RSYSSGHGNLQVCDRTCLDLPHPFSANAELGSDNVETRCLLRQMPLLDNVSLARLQAAEGPVEQAPTVIPLFLVAYDLFGVWPRIKQHILEIGRGISFGEGSIQ